ncbi:MAG: 1,4-alpha-glucan branching protein GlgB [Proteobacteria bacterium]|nr:1,4-alpha-glucan branching protein GlgB [Cystobacterineae bacterium]MCL2259598.1 1,4-alpha-glucan branching protein GlgB [Cystobacterineae bacterium]MCL2313920.1 1,4-alpha-glucan branching protein GlgB [Pseudomonadota bacterium]
MLESLCRLRHANPHSFLGRHVEPSGVWIRAWRPDARTVELLVDSQHLPMQAVAHGLFECCFPENTAPLHYRFKIHSNTGQELVIEDPYRFLPFWGEVDLHLFGEGSHQQLWKKMGAHFLHDFFGASGVAFSVWAPNAEGVSVIGDFNNWDTRLHPMRSMGASGIWELFVPEITPGAKYKFQLQLPGGATHAKADPFAFQFEVPPKTASIVNQSHYVWGDNTWRCGLPQQLRSDKPLSVYEVHLSSWRKIPEEDNRSLNCREAAHALADYVKGLGFTHVELMPVTEHPFSGSWGYQVSGYFAPTSRFGSPDDFRFFVDTLHQHGIGVIVDWVPAHFPRDQFALAYFDGTALYEHADPRRGLHPDWGTAIFNYGRHEVRNFLLSSALYWIEEFHIDGFRVDAVASMLYLDYSRNSGEWMPNTYGGRENLEAIDFLRNLNETIQARYPGTLVMAEESTAWPQVSRPTSVGGLGFTHKWNMGWMHDNLKFFQRDPVHRSFHHNELTFGLLYAFTENFVLPLSHDEVVHGKGSLISRMPGDLWQKFANLRSLYAWMWAHPGKKLLFMGGEFAQFDEWNHEQSLDWHLLEYNGHRELPGLVRELNRLYREEPALHQRDFRSDGFCWLQANAADVNTYAFFRRGDIGREIICVANLSPVIRENYRIGCPTLGRFHEILNTDWTRFGGSGVSNPPQDAAPTPWDGQMASLSLTLPPLGVVYLARH